MKRIKRKVIEALIKHHPNDADLGAVIRKLFAKRNPADHVGGGKVFFDMADKKIIVKRKKKQ